MQKISREELLADTQALLKKGVWAWLPEDVKTFGSRLEPGGRILKKGSLVRIAFVLPDGKAGVARSGGRYPAFEALVDLETFEGFDLEVR